jgi:peroxiredoxin
MVMMIRKSLTLIALGALTLAAGQLSGRRAPSFALMDSGMRYHDILDYRGKVLILDLMQTNCPHCQKLTVLLERVKAKMGDKIQVLSMVTLPDTTATVSKYIAAHKVTSPMLFDSGQVMAAYMKIDPLRPAPVDFPHLFIVDAQGFIREDFGQQQVQSLTEASLTAAINQAMQGGIVAAPPQPKSATPPPVKKK